MSECAEWARHTCCMTNELIDEFSNWLVEAGAPDVVASVNYAETFLDWRANAPLPNIDESVIREFLLRWCPRQLNLPPGDSWRVCTSVAAFVDFLGYTGRLNGGPRAAEALIGITIELADAMESKMADPNNFGMAKSLFAGIEGAESMTGDELMAALQQRVDEHNARPWDERKALTDRFFEPETLELPFLYIPPPEADVAAVAASAKLPAHIEALRDYLGESGKALTAKGNLKLADGRALVDILDTGDQVDPKYGDKTYKTHTTERLTQLMHRLALAEAVGAVRTVNNRLVPVKAWSRRSPIDKATRLFQSVVDYGVLTMTHRGIGFYAEVHEAVDDFVVHWLAGLMAPQAQGNFADIAELNAFMVGDQFPSQEAEYYLSGDGLAGDLSQIIHMLDLTGAVEWIGRQESTTRWGRRFWTGGTVAITAFGRHVLPSYLPAAGIVLRTAGDLTEASLPDLIAAMGDAPPEQHSAMLSAWKPSLRATERAGLVTALIAKSADAHTRLVGLRLLGMFDADVAEPHMRQLLDTAAAGHAAIWLIENGSSDRDTLGDFVTPAVLVDILSQMIDHPELLCEQFLAASDSEHMLEFFWHHPAPETASVLDALGQHLPDRALAKMSRKAAMRHRSWMANGGGR